VSYNVCFGVRVLSYKFEQTIKLLTPISEVRYLFFEIPPVPKQRPRRAKFGGVFTPKKTKVFEDSIRLLAKAKYHLKPMEGPIGLGVSFVLQRPKSVKRYYPHVKPDLDNLLKSVVDGLNGILYQDDCQIVECFSQKEYGDESGIVVAVWQVPVDIVSPR